MSKIPSHAECVFKGVIFDVYQWQQTMFDGNTATFERLKRKNTAVILPLNGDTVFYAEQKQPDKSTSFVSLFGGRAEENEEPLETAKRELLEETGFIAEDWQLLFKKEFGGKIDWDVYYYVARNCRKVQEPNLDGGEVINVKSTTLDDFISTIVANPTFSENELKERLYSAFNPEAAAQFQAQLKA